MLLRPTLLAVALALSALGHSATQERPRIASGTGGIREMATAPSESAIPPSRRAATGTIIGSVVIQGTDVHLGYSVVSIASLNREQFTDGEGRFTLRDVAAGKLILRVKHIGYTPVDLPVTVHGDDTVLVRAELSKLVVDLPPVRSVGRCAKPGAPNAKTDNALFTLFEQVKQNAERSRLLTRSYPFKYSVVRTSAMQSSADPSAPPDTQSVDTLTGESQRDWRYSPGRMVVMEHDGDRFGETLVLPQLGDFADDAFIKNHCFGYAGIEDADGGALARIDFAPAEKIGDPDISGTVYLDSATLQIRRAQITLTKPSRALQRSLTGVTITTIYRELAPGIPMMAEFSSVTMLPKEQWPAGWSASLISQQIISVDWLKGKP